MKIPRDVNGDDLARKLSKLEYKIVRQTGSHIRLTTTLNGEHHITIPAHRPIKIGTLNSILSDLAEHFKFSKEEILKKIF